MSWFNFFSLSPKIDRQLKELSTELSDHQIKEVKKLFAQHAKSEIDVYMPRNDTFRVDMKSLRESPVVKEQLQAASRLIHPTS
ncbi:MULTISPECIES: hypothetical protein [unclassified Pseudoalteromonas]|uniref:hypothetical protein n=1 Tax=unclassified Pseudoalteromonas TaxID=194690 RepID=UPI000EE6760E|nr:MULTISPECIES: hypothetical protein [unclassified Pseudoalteromonas]HAG39308.1 hypothetical protein [Pseudoalteromonas sp.]|tara:strand:+ start:8879 stop:9127 length:249 start_codon:yes stop_codon:yes gene_type:complete